jgi:uncharacterized membrane protein
LSVHSGYFLKRRILGMTVLIVLFASWLGFRALGALGVPALAAWSAAARYALSVMFLFTGLAHFTKMKHELARMVPDVFPRPLLVIYATGVLEFLGAAGLLLPKFRTAASFCLIVLLIAMFPANVKAARERLTLRGKPATALRLRAPMQLLFVALLWWSAAQ